MRSITTLSNQTVFDVSLRYMGSVEAVFDILQLNKLIRADVTIPAGTLIELPDKPINQRVVDYYEFNNINPATSWQEQ